MKKNIILSGGSKIRLYPMMKKIGKQLISIYDNRLVDKMLKKNSLYEEYKITELNIMYLEKNRVKIEHLGVEYDSFNTVKNIQNLIYFTTNNLELTICKVIC